MYAVIVTGGKQHKVVQGDVLYIEKLDVKESEDIVFDQVVMTGDNGKIKVGKPFVKGATVKATAIKNGKAKKVTVFTYRAKKDSKRKMGHRQPYTKVQITEIVV